MRRKIHAVDMLVMRTVESCWNIASDELISGHNITATQIIECADDMIGCGRHARKMNRGTKSNDGNQILAATQAIVRTTRSDRIDLIHEQTWWIIGANRADNEKRASNLLHMDHVFVPPMT